MIYSYFNKFLTDDISLDVNSECAFNSDDILPFHRSLPGYGTTPFVSLPSLSKKLGVGSIFVKDESYRFGLKAFKCMGASYAIYRFIKQLWEQKIHSPFQVEYLFDTVKINRLHLPRFCTATDGNHGRAVAWMSKIIGHPAVIYMPLNSVPARCENIRNENAELVIVDGDYDEAVQRSDSDAKQNGWQVISDTSYSGYTEIPAYIQAGYTTIFEEIDQQHSSDFDFIFLQSGVGSFAASAAWYYKQKKQQTPALISVEPTGAACLLQSVLSETGVLTTSTGKQDSIMAGLNCATPSIIAWDIIRQSTELFIAIEDRYAREAMKIYHYPENQDHQIISGESGAAGLAGLLALLNDENYRKTREKMNFNRNSRILLFNTEGDTDPVNYRKVITGE